MSKEITKFFENEKLIKDIAKEIITAFVKDANKDNIDYDFDIAKGTGKLKSKTPNTSFYFDTKKGTKLDKLKKALFNEDLKGIEEESKEEKELMDKTTEFLRQVAEEVNFSYGPQLQDVIRKTILPKSREEDIPLNEITIISIDVADFSSIPEPKKYLLKIGKEPNTYIKTGEVTEFVHNTQETTGKTVFQVFEDEKGINPLFDNITGLEAGRKYLFDISITLFVDYSLLKLPPEEMIKK